MNTFRIAAMLGLMLIAMQAQAEEPIVIETAEEVQACTRKYASFPGSGSGEISCLCPVDAHIGSVWGDGIYTTDSSICAAAVHAGVIAKGKGGMVKAKPAPGCKVYGGSKANGVSSNGWGEFKSSFYFPGKGDGKCKAAPKDLCPRNFQALGGKTEATCTCIAESMRGSVYGTGIYTTDSSICNAALHAGVITKDGGKVTVKGAPGCGSYKGTKANGVSTSKWGKYRSSFYFPDKGDGKCP